MALTVPTVQQLADFKGEEIAPEEVDGALMHLQAAADLMELATGIHQDFPSDTLQYRVMQRGILDMAWYIGTSMEDRDASFSPFSSERIGSYSYSKAQKAVSMKGETGVPFFDLAVSFLIGDERSEYGDGFFVSSEAVMPPETWWHS